MPYLHGFGFTQGVFFVVISIAVVVLVVVVVGIVVVVEYFVVFISDPMHGQ